MHADAAGRAGYARGAAWAALSGGASILLPLAVFVIFARTLGPEVIARFALAVSLAEILKACGMPGLYEALLHKRSRPARHQAAALAAFLSIGLLLLPVYGVALALLLATAGANPQGGELPLLLLIGLRIPIDLALLAPQAELARRAAYARLAVRGLIGNIGATTVGLAILAAGQPILGLAAYTLGISVGNALATVIGTGTLRRPRWNGACLRALWPEGIAASAVRFCATANNQVDQLLVGAIAGPLQFALFNFAKRVEAAFGSLSAILVTSLFQPDFAARLTVAARSAGLRHALTIVAMTCGPVAAGFAVSADLFIGVLLGPAWMAAAPAAAVLAVSGYGRAIGGVHAALLSVSGRNGRLFRRFALTVVVGAVLVASIARYGALASAFAVAAQILFGVVLLAITTRQDAGGHALRIHLLHAVLPFLAMLAAAACARWMVLGLAWNAGVPTMETSIAAVVAASAAAAMVGLACGVAQMRHAWRAAPGVAPPAEAAWRA